MPQTIQPHRLAQALDGHRGIKMLSLDCFDTLLWRDVHASHDIFELLDGVTPRQRRWADQAARKDRKLAYGASNEVTLREIYAKLLPNLDAAAREAYVEREIAAEARHCYAFAPTVELMREAKRRGLPVIIVSDSYLERDQLEGLIRAAAGDEVADMIDTIFCSCEYRSSKSERLFDTVLKHTAMRPDGILHIGDNKHADAISGMRHGLQALHLVQFADATVQRLRQERTAGALMMGGGTAFQPHRATLSLNEGAITGPAEAMGFAAVGPIMTNFAHWIAAEAAELNQAHGGKVHLMFLMRDGYLPQEVFAAIHPTIDTHAIEISRFAATSASLTDAAAIRKFIIEEIGHGAGIDFLRQLHVVGDEAHELLDGLPEDDPHALADALQTDEWVEKISARGEAYADRLADYIRVKIDPARGDTLMLVDVGYKGTVQGKIAAQIADTFGVKVAGRYLLLLEDEISGLDKRGMLALRNHDVATLETLMSAFIVLEQFCTLPQGSVVDYREGGQTVRAAVQIRREQNSIREAVQAGCLSFARTDGTAMIRRTAVSPDAAHRGAVSALARLLYLPLADEIKVMTRFEHDWNLGGDFVALLFDPDAAERGLRERGLFYLKNSRRLFLPAELRGQGLPTSLTLLTQRRFGLDLRFPDFADHTLPVTVLMTDGNKAFTDVVQAHPTHQGYYVAAVPIGAGRYTVGVQFGRDFELVQIESACFLPVSSFLDGEAATRLTTNATPYFEDMEQIAPDIFRCGNAESFLMVAPPPVQDRVSMMLAITFRPLVKRCAAPSSTPTTMSVLTGATA
ncbi:HAD family hydrolase [Sphingomonas mollis]|uniref:HAD family hydrolase n=1 Tax=Sphingomonas mollis TaxID=2795726 RepID=A0ABS0XQR8_9SPHN|nr:HAD family hydrolase [Sphingomonas sp. BT553]MBJ6122130.1 HAD family hydrolase [Sphingomonas sp. BT553]